MSRFITPIMAIPKIVFFPNASLPFQIADPLYLRMVGEALEKNIPITVALAEPLAEIAGHGIQYAPHQVATMGNPRLLETKPGSVKILMQGISRVRILGVVQHLPYLVAEVETIPDKEEEFLSDNKLEHLHKLFREWISTNLINPKEREMFLNQTTKSREVMDYLSMFLIQDVELKQILLECDSPFERVHMLHALLSDKRYFSENPAYSWAIKSFEIIDKISKIAS